MTELSRYFTDGANHQARAVLSYLSAEDFGATNPTVARWENCREQGYVISLRSTDRQLNIAFFEHRNTDNICAVKWEQVTDEPPTIKTAEFGDIYKNKYDLSCEFPWGEVTKMALWIYGELMDFWQDCQRERRKP